MFQYSRFIIPEHILVSILVLQVSVNIYILYIMLDAVSYTH